jgi:ABC-2 type transport system permease protein
VAWLLVVGPVALVLAAVLPGISDPGGYPWVLALVPVVLGAGAGLIMLLSVFAGYPLPEQKANPFAAGGNPGLVRTAQQLGISLLLGVVAAPVVVLLLLAGDNPVLRWSAVPLGIAIGVVLFWWWGRIAYRRLAARGPEILAAVGKKI